MQARSRSESSPEASARESREARGALSPSGTAAAAAELRKLERPACSSPDPEGSAVPGAQPGKEKSSTPQSPTQFSELESARPSRMTLKAQIRRGCTRRSDSTSGISLPGCRCSRVLSSAELVDTQAGVGSWALLRPACTACTCTCTEEAKQERGSRSRKPERLMLEGRASTHSWGTRVPSPEKTEERQVPPLTAAPGRLRASLMLRALHW